MVDQNDLIGDMLRRIAVACSYNSGQFNQAIATVVERAIRDDWGGDRVFISRKIGRDHSERNGKIIRDYLNGERLALLERRYQLTSRRLLQIVKQQ